MPKDFYEEYLEQHTLDEILKMSESRKVIPQPSFGDKPYGILFGDDTVLKYFDLKEKKTYSLVKASHHIYGILAAEDEVYYGEWDGGVKSLFLGFASKKRGIVNALQKQGKNILDSGDYGLVNTLNGEVLISPPEMIKRNIEYIASLPFDPQGHLFGLVEYKDKTHGLIEIPGNRGQYFLGEEVLKYDANHDLIIQAIIFNHRKLLGRNGKEYHFSVLSCVNSNYLDLNGEKISGSEVGNWHIYRVELFRPVSDDTVEVVYSGSDLYQVIKAKINLKSREVMEKEVLVGSLGSRVNALGPVRSYPLHQKLIRKEKKHA
ncbi:hypothetical protein HZC30_03865 [Candidatus Woesearchaeota archaeon]|nr:hypothetical protein [Candidatus Woesearchaeota archaeon]